MSECPECGGTGYYQGPRLGDEPCPRCMGTGEAWFVDEHGDLFQTLPDGTRRWLAKISEPQRRRKG